MECVGSLGLGQVWHCEENRGSYCCQHQHNPFVEQLVVPVDEWAQWCGGGGGAVIGDTGDSGGGGGGN